MKKNKREREEPCPMCNHYHDYLNGETCQVCGHTPAVEGVKPRLVSSFPAEIVKGFLYLGDYDHAYCAAQLLHLQISYILNTVPSAPTAGQSSHIIHTVSQDPPSFDECLSFLRQVKEAKGRVLVHCMTGKSRSVSVVLAYLLAEEKLSLQAALQRVLRVWPKVQMRQADFLRCSALETSLFGAPQPSLTFEHAMQLQDAARPAAADCASAAGDAADGGMEPEVSWVFNEFTLTPSPPPAHFGIQQQLLKPLTAVSPCPRPRLRRGWEPGSLQEDA